MCCCSVLETEQVFETINKGGVVFRGKNGVTVPLHVVSVAIRSRQGNATRRLARGEERGQPTEHFQPTSSQF